MKSALTDAKAAGADRIVLDLRGNPGGYVNEAVAIASQFLVEGSSTSSATPTATSTPHPVAQGGVATDLPLVVLVDGGTASSSEIVSGALQDAGRAQIVGATTFGTGTVLGEFPLSDGSALRIGTVEWLTPKGRRIWHDGITPDVVVERASDVAPLDPAQVGKMTAAQVAKLDRSAARQGARASSPRSPPPAADPPQPARDRQRQVISAISGRSGWTIVGSVLIAFGGAVWGSTHRASSGAV